MAVVLSSSKLPPAEVAAAAAAAPCRPSNSSLHHPSFPIRISSFMSCSYAVSHACLRLQRPASPVQQVYTYPDPIPEFAQLETVRFRNELRRKLLKSKDTFGEDMTEVINVCSEIFNKFLHQEYGGPGTFIVEPFTDMLLALKERKLPGAPVAARAALLWAQNNLDQDWELYILKSAQS